MSDRQKMIFFSALESASLFFENDYSYDMEARSDYQLDHV